MAKIIYNALLLTPKSKELVFRKFKGIHPNKYGEHVTLEFSPRHMPDNIGDIVNIEVIGYSSDDKGEALVVSLNTVSSKNKVPHITLSTASGVKPFYSNELLSHGYESITPIKIETVVSSFVAGKGHITEPFSSF
jgi:hypothetical protein